MSSTTFAQNNFASGHIGDTNDIRRRFKQISDYIYDALKFKGKASAATIAAASPENHDVYISTGAGTLNTGGDAITVATGDIVYYDEATELWVFFHDLA